MKKYLLLSMVIFWVYNFSSSVFAQVDLYLDEINVYVNTYGNVQIYTLPDTIQQISRTSILVATEINTVFDYYEDLEVEDPTELLANPSFGDYEIYGSYNNEYSGAPPNVLEKLNVYCWQNQNSIIVKYTIINRESNSINAIFGLDLVPEVENSFSGGDTVTYSSLSKIISVRKTESIGYKPLSGSFKSLSAFVWYDEYWLGDTTLYNWLTYNSFDSLFITDPNDPNVDDPVLIPAYNSQTLATGDSLVQYIAIAYGANETEMLASLQQAQEKYDQLTSVETTNDLIPGEYTLKQNYPNPFNPVTNINFSIPGTEFVNLTVYNLLGEAVAELVNNELASGNYTYEFDASKLTSGIYFYTVTAGNYSETKKMTLMK